ncbi:MAG: class I adenylate-forming enzyme family protein [Pseudomonadota bacterium]
MQTPCPAPFNLADYVLTAGRATPEKIALVVMGLSRSERWSYARLEAAVLGMAGALSARVKPGGRILLRLGNTPDFPVAFLGAVAAGLVPMPSSSSLTGPEITRLANLTDPDLILAAPGIDLPDHPAPVEGDLATLAAHSPGKMQMGDPNRLAYIVFTSGSSGEPRAVAHAHRAIWARRMMWRGWYGLRPEDRLCHSGAFNWTYTLGTGLFDPWAAGATALIAHDRVEPAQLPLLLRRHDASIFASVPGIYRKVLKAPLPALPRLRHGLSAGERLAPTLRTAWQDATGTDIHEALGMSEISTFISGAPSRPAPDGSTGYAQAGRRIAILDDHGAELPPGTPGILAVHRDDPGLMLGYLDGATPYLPLTGEWFLTGDQVSLGMDGAAQYQARRDELLTAGGFRVAPAEIEAAFADAPGLSDCAACEIDISDDVRIIALAHEGSAQEDDLTPLAAARLARYKQPKVFVRLSALPRGSNGKLNRKSLARLIKESMP